MRWAPADLGHAGAAAALAFAGAAECGPKRACLH
jgi:hypothetical protein